MENKTMKPSIPGITPTPAKSFSELLAMALECAMRFGQGKSSNESKAKELQSQILERHASLVSRVTELEKALRECLSWICNTPAVGSAMGREKFRIVTRAESVLSSERAIKHALGAEPAPHEEGRK
jgi:hypothetical protein